MKLCIIHGQMHHGSTWNVTQRLKEKLIGDASCSEFYLPKDGPDSCVGCFCCFKGGLSACPHSEKVLPIYEAMRAADVLIFDSPTYCMLMSGQLNTLFNHFGHIYLSHSPREEFFQKIAIAVSTTAGAGAKLVTKNIARQCFFYGIPKTYQLPLVLQAGSWEEVTEKRKAMVERKTERIAGEILQRPRRAAPPKTRLFFQLMRKMHGTPNINPADHAYWKEKGWLGRERPWK